MAIRETTQDGDPILKATNRTVDNFQDPKVKQVIEDLVETMLAIGLVGMAAPQIGENFRIFVTEPRVTPSRTIDQADELRIYINPKIVKKSEEEIIIYEGCGSVEKATIFGPVKRAREVTVEAFDQNGKKFQLTCDGLLARVVLHEMDHLEGMLFKDRVEDKNSLVDVDSYVKEIKTSEEQLRNSKIMKKEVTWL